MCVVEIKQLCKQYGNKIILNNIDFQIEKGEILGLLGPSGSGKTTIVKHIAGIEKPTSGDVYVLGKKMPNRVVSIELGYMGQSDALYEDLTGYENLRFFASLYNIKQKMMKEKIVETFDMLDLSEALHKKVCQYSGGMKKRLSLAIAIIHQPKLLILDEPTVGIDPVLRKSVWAKFYEMKKEGTTLLITTHIMEEIEKCDKAVLIRNGHVIENDTVMNLKDKTESGKIEELFFNEEVVL